MSLLEVADLSLSFGGPRALDGLSFAVAEGVPAHGGGKLPIVVADVYEVTAVNIDSQVLKAQANGAGVVFLFAIPKFIGMYLKKAHEIGWEADVLDQRGIGQPDNLEAGRARLRPAGQQEPVRGLRRDLHPQVRPCAAPGVI